MSDTLTKICTKCEQSFPATAEFFQHHSSTSDGLQPRCKNCRKVDRAVYYAANTDKIRVKHAAYCKANSQRIVEYRKEWYRENRNRILVQQKNRKKATNPQFKTREEWQEFTTREALASRYFQGGEIACTKCWALFPPTREFFRPQKAGLFGLRSTCISCDRAYGQAFHAANPQKRRASAARWRANNIEYSLKRAVEYHLANPAYAVWYALLRRCNDPAHKNWKNYGAIGVKVCERLKTSHESFVAEIGERPSLKHSLSRQLDIGGYTCGHCDECQRNGWLRNVEWGTKADQAAERRGKVAMKRLHQYHQRIQKSPQIKSATVAA